MQAVVIWNCPCGVTVKAILDMSKAGMTVQCATPSCKASRALPGEITRLWTETEQRAWDEVDVNFLIYPPSIVRSDGE
jgi:hypothetical protein